MTTFDPQVLILTIFHVLISLVAIATGFVVVFDWILRRERAPWVQIFLWTTIATSVTGFFFPITRFTPGIALGIISLVVLGFTLYALYAKRLAGPWRKVYVGTAVAALYFNFFVLIVQLFQKIPPLHAAAPTQAEPPFAITQGSVLLVFIILGVLAALRFRPLSLDDLEPVTHPTDLPLA